MVDGYLLSESDMMELRLLVKESRNKRLSNTSTTNPKFDDSQAPDIYIAKAPSGGIPRNTFGKSGSITGATNANPIVITTSVAHTLNTGDRVTIAGVDGNTAANETWSVTSLTATTFSVPIAGNGTYTGGGTWTGLVGSAICGIYRLLDDKPFSLNSSLTVYNFSLAAILADTYLPIARDKLGSWMVIDIKPQAATSIEWKTVNPGTGDVEVPVFAPTSIQIDQASGLQLVNISGIGKVQSQAASTTHSGVVNITTQSFTGIKSFVNHVNVDSLAVIKDGTNTVTLASIAKMGTSIPVSSVLSGDYTSKFQITVDHSFDYSTGIVIDFDSVGNIHHQTYNADSGLIVEEIIGRGALSTGNPTTRRDSRALWSVQTGQGIVEWLAASVLTPWLGGVLVIGNRDAVYNPTPKFAVRSNNALYEGIDQTINYTKPGGPPGIITIRGGIITSAT